MNENEVVATEETEVVNDAVATEVVPVKDEKMTFSQKFAGLGVIGLAIAGLVWAILGIVKGVKWVIRKIKGKKEQPKVEEAINPDDYVDDGELTEDEANEIGNK